METNERSTMTSTRQVRRVNREKGGTTNKTVLTWAQEFSQLKATEKQIKARVTEIRQRLLDLLEKQGYEDDKHHLWIDLPDEVDGATKLQRQYRSSVSIDEEAAMDLIKRKGLEKECTRTVTVLDTEALAKAQFEGKITEDEFDALTREKVSYAVLLV